MKYFLTAVVLLFCMNASAQKISQHIELQGQWKASPKGDVIFLEFGKDSTFKFRHTNDSLGGKSFFFGAGEATSKFKADTSMLPMQLDLLVIEVATGTVINKMEGIFEVIGPGKIRVRMSMDGSKRPLSFLPKGNEDTVVFVRQN
jgi:hypothetical protein